MIRISFFALALSATPLAAQDVTPKFDPQVLDTCLFDTQVEEHESCIGVAADQCMETEGGSSTAGMNDCVGHELEIWDKKLNEAYNTLMAAAKQVDEGYADETSSPNRAGLLKEMQVNWIAFRDATCAFERSEYHGGSMASNVGMGCLLDMTAKQALVLDGFNNATDDR